MYKILRIGFVYLISQIVLYVLLTIIPLIITFVMWDFSWFFEANEYLYRMAVVVAIPLTILINSSDSK